MDVMEKLEWFTFGFIVGLVLGLFIMNYILFDVFRHMVHP